MDIRVSGHQIDTGAALQEHVDDRLNSIVDKYFSRAISSHVTFGKGPGGAPRARRMGAGKSSRRALFLAVSSNLQ